MNKRIAIRLVMGLFAIAVLFFGWQMLSERVFVDPFALGSAKTAGMIAAIEYVDGGSRAVLFKADGTKVDSPDYKTGAQDSEIAWSPDGNRLYFSSDRKRFVDPKDSAFQIFRWNPDRNKVDARTSGTRSMSAPWFGLSNDSKASSNAVVLAGGFVLDLDVHHGATSQLLPPVARGNATTANPEEGGVTGQFEGPYARIGQSFKEARWGQNHEVMYAVMRRDAGEVFLMQRMSSSSSDPEVATREMMPIALLAAKEIQFDVASDGAVVVVLRDFQFVDQNNIPKPFIKNGVAVPPYKHAVIRFTLENGQPKAEMVMVSKDDKHCASDPAVSPDGSKLALSLGTFADGVNFKPEALMVMPFADRGVMQATPLVRGFVRQPGWSPDGKTLVYAKSAAGSTQCGIWTIGADGSGEKQVSGEGDFGMPCFSPQLK